MDHGRDEDQENILEDMIRGEDDVDVTSSFSNDSGEGVEIEADGSDFSKLNYYRVRRGILINPLLTK